MNGTHQLNSGDARKLSASAAPYSPQKQNYGIQTKGNQSAQNAAKRALQTQFVQPPSSYSPKYQVNLPPPPGLGFDTVSKHISRQLPPSSCIATSVSPTATHAIVSLSPTFNRSENDARLFQKVESLFNNGGSKETISALLQELYSPLSQKSVQIALDHYSNLKDLHDFLSSLKEKNHGPLTKALRDGCSKEKVLDLYQSQTLFTEDLLSLVIIRSEALCIFPDMLKNYIGLGKPLRYRFVEEACEYKRPMSITKSLIESFKNPNDEQVCAFFSAALYYKYYENEPEILPYLMSKFTKTHESSVLDILRDLTDDFEFAHALPQLTGLATSFIKEGGAWTSELIESVLGDYSTEDARPLLEAMIASQKPISEETFEIALRSHSAQDMQPLLFAAFLEKGGKASSQLLKTSLSSPYASLAIVKLIILEIVKEQECLTEEQVNMPTDYDLGKEKQDLLRMYGPVGTTISL